MNKNFTILLFSVFYLISCETLNIDLKNGSLFDKKEKPAQILEIKQKHKEYNIRHTFKIFNDKPNYNKPYQSGELNEDFLNNGLRTTKFIRYLAGLSENIVLTNDLNDLAQHGAVLLAKTGKLTHTPKRPSDMEKAFYTKGYKSTTSSNIHHGINTTGSLSNAVKSFCDDSDVSNIDRLGHRRWILNPQLGKIGFGYSEININNQKQNFITMQVFDKSNNDQTDMDYIAWPNAGYFPNNYFSAHQAWSISLNPNSFKLKSCKPRVKLTNIDNDKEWVFTSKDKNKSGKYYNIEQSGFGYPYCIIFKPDNIMSLLFNKRFKVEVEGLIDKNGKEKAIIYDVEFFTLF